MNNTSGDDWPKPRKTFQHLTSHEIAVIKFGFENRYTISAVARELRCSSRTVTKYYGYFRAEGVEQRGKP